MVFKLTLPQGLHVENLRVDCLIRFRLISRVQFMSRSVSRIEAKCIENGLKMTGQRRVIARVLSDSDDHPDVEMLFQRASEVDNRISIATVYRTLKLFEEAGITQKHDFGDGRARYEEAPREHHDHLINVKTGEIIEFTNEEIEKLQKLIAQKLGYKLIDHRLELYGVPLDNPK